MLPSPDVDPVLAVADLTVRYATAGGAVPAVSGVSFDVRPGEVLGLVGESGSGKSTVCSAISRLLPHGARIETGTITFEGTDLASLDEAGLVRVRGRRIALVPQHPLLSLSPTSPVGRQIEWHLGERAHEPATREALASIGLQVVLDRPGDLPSQFSGGQLQRLIIALATLAHHPALLLADEPTTTLDPTVQAQVLRLLLDVREQLGLSVLYVSHDLAVIAQVCDRVGVMYGGRLVEVAPVEDLFDHPRHPYTKALLDAIPSMAPTGPSMAPTGPSMAPTGPSMAPTGPSTSSAGAARGAGRLRAIPGTAAGANRLAGCPFAPRCPLATDVCRTTVPGPVVVGRTEVRCHAVDPSAALFTPVAAP